MMSEVDKVKKPAKVKHTRSRYGCKECKKSKMKCDELKPTCSSCLKKGKQCDYSVTLTWGGRPYKKPKEEAMLKVPREMTLSDLPMSFGTLDMGMSQMMTHSSSTPMSNIRGQQVAQLQSDSGKSMSKSLSVGSAGKLIFTDDLSKTMSEYSQSLTTVPNHLKKQSSKRSIEQVSEAESPEFKKSSIEPSPSLVKYAQMNLAPGIESLTSALGSITGDKAVNFENLNFINDLSYIPTPNSNDLEGFVSGNNIVNHLQTQIVGASQFDDLFLDIDTYQEDLLKIDKLFDSDPSKTLLLDPFVSRMVLHRSHRPVDQSDIEDEEDDKLIKDELSDYDKQIRLIRKVSEGDTNSIHTPTTTSSSSTRFSIPRGLVPLPDLLLNVPYYLESFHFFRDVTSSTLVPLPEHLYLENPFKVILPRLAMSNESILSILVAFGITHRSFMLGQTEPKEVLDQLISRCLKDLILLLEDRENCKSDLTLALVLMIGSFDMFSCIQNNWKLHVLGAKQILIKRGLKNPFNKQALELTSIKLSSIDKLPVKVSSDPRIFARETNVTGFLVGWFNYIEILRTLATSLKPSQPSSPEMEWQKYDSGNKTAFYSLDEDVEIDMFLGFDVRFLQIASEMIKLIRKVNYYFQISGENPNKVLLPRDFTVLAVEIRENLHQVFQTSTEKYVGDQGDALDVLRATNELYYLALLLHLYRRVFMISKFSNVVRSLCLKVIKIFREKIVAGSNLEICSSFVIFTTLLEVVDQESRSFLFGRLTNQFNIGNYISKKIQFVLQKSWETGRNWTDIVDEYQIDLTFV